MITSRGAIIDDKVRVFSRGGPGFGLDKAVMTKLSPDGTAFTLALYHPPPAAGVAILTAKDLKQKE